MNYFISRDNQEYGPYTLADLQRYASSGEVLLTDLAHGEGLTELLPVAQIIGTIAAPPRPIPGAPLAAQYLDQYPDPPNLHWGLVFLFGVLSCGLFTAVWDIIQAAWLKKVEPTSNAIYFYIISAATLVLLFIASYASAAHGQSASQSGYVSLVNLLYFGVIITARFSMKNGLEKHFNGPEPMGLMLSGVMTFFFGGIYFQYHFNDIVRRKNYDRMNAGLAPR